MSKFQLKLEKTLFAVRPFDGLIIILHHSLVFFLSFLHSPTMSSNNGFHSFIRHKNFEIEAEVLSCCFSAKAAHQAVKAGVDGILVSAHGGRQLAGVPAPVSLTWYYKKLCCFEDTDYQVTPTYYAFFYFCSLHPTYPAFFLKIVEILLYPTFF